MIKRIIPIILLVVLLSGLLVTPVYAKTYQQPDYFQISSVAVLANALVLDDNLVIVRGSIGYTNAGDIPTTPIDDTYIFNLRNGAGEILSSTTTYGYANEGYGTAKGQKFVASFYFSPENALTWGDNTYKVSFEGNPTLSWNGTTPSKTFNPFTTWYDEDTISATQNTLLSTLLVVANDLTLDWGWTTTPLLQNSATGSGQVLSYYGETYFTTVIPNLRSMCPDLFYQSMTAAEFKDVILVSAYFVDEVTNAELIYGVNWCAQTFVADGSYSMSGIQLPLYRLGNPGDVTISLRATLAGLPTGANLATGTYNGNSLTTNTNGQWIAQAFTVDYSLTSGTTYAIVVAATAGNINNYVGWVANNGNKYDNGQVCTSVNSGVAWVAVATDDAMFELLVRGGSGLDLGNRYKVALLGSVFDISQIGTNWGIDSIWLMTILWLAMTFVIIAVMAIAINAWNCWWIILNMMVSYGWRAGFVDTNLLVGVLVMSAIGIVWGIWFKRAN